MSTIHFELTPPRKSTVMAPLSPNSSLDHATIKHKLKRQSSQLLGSPQLKKMALCPATTTEDRTMDGYHDRITAEAVVRMTVVLPVKEITSVCLLSLFDNEFDNN